ncbi:uncharacterized protein LOC121307281 isoform X2 [Polyodon spathula]|uniref:uncharacterized protein LOC121307281 isoform X2 n=1 Tax=Polyodon spathula TaxID=7913 RepID=UPI001B7EA874|nr:uncharacterized protein LOC121307281 isoform X2 [Polyodon spathula]
MNQTRNRFDPRNSSPEGGLNNDLVENILNRTGQNRGQNVPDLTSKTSKLSGEPGSKENFYKRTTQALAVLLLSTVTAGAGLHYSKMSSASAEYSSLFDSHADLVQKLEGMKLDYSELQERYAAVEEQLTSVHKKFTSLQGAHSDLQSKFMSGVEKYLPQGENLLENTQENALETLPVDLSFSDNAGSPEREAEYGSDDWTLVSEGRGLISGQDLTAEVKDDNSGFLISRAASFLSKLGVPAVLLSFFAYAFKKRGSIAGQLHKRLGKKMYPDSLSSKGNGFDDVLSENVVPVNVQNQHISFEKPTSTYPEHLEEPDSAYSSSFNSSMDLSPKGGVVLDPYTAYPKLILSQDGKRLRLGDQTQAVSDNNPERFDYWECAVGKEGFTSGRHFWEVDVGENQHWKLGVTRASAQRKGEFSMLPRDGYWTLWWYGEQLWALTDPLTSLAPGLKVQKVGVSLVYDEGRLSFYDVESGTLIHTFTDVFTERIYPFFWTWDTSTDLVIL